MNRSDFTAMRDLSIGFEVVVLGGGPAGCATAMALAQHGIRDILIVESGDYTSARVGESIPPDTRLLLNELGIWEEFLQQAHEPCLGSCSSWGDDVLGYNDFLFNPLGHGWHLDRIRFDQFLAKMAARKGITVCTNTRFVRCEPQGSDGHGLSLQSKSDEKVKEISARFVVDAMGMHSGLARQMGARKRFLDRLICAYGFFDYSATHDFSRLTILESSEYGWWYAARLPNNKLAVAIASDPETVRQRALCNARDWLCELKETRHIAPIVAGREFNLERPLTYPALSFILDKISGDNWLAVGDAASSYDPISSQGIYKALFDGLSAAKIIVQYLAGEANSLDAYQIDILSRFNHYLENRNFFYAMEKRWPNSLFWTRRQERTHL
ncbi:NAD(P)/FAD-dependent oxidoreductase [uncultured Roseibium sp.]|uniref:NAD(P)/FAD-dependent oxidoreductase n=1 Tax=uncultured Roseibium sp. TaxID=1936171 RepID=UPI002618B2D1|nr:NAD(P)/FAD-dependent oxidoreductase [uncultured Roseibium sp.]